MHNYMSNKTIIGVLLQQTRNSTQICLWHVRYHWNWNFLLNLLCFVFYHWRCLGGFSSKCGCLVSPILRFVMTATNHSHCYKWLVINFNCTSSFCKMYIEQLSIIYNYESKFYSNIIS